MGRKKKAETIAGACDTIVSGVVDGVNDWFDDIKRAWSGTKKRKRRSKKETISKVTLKQTIYEAGRTAKKNTKFNSKTGEVTYSDFKDKERKTIKEAIKQLEWAGYRVQKPARFGEKNDNQ